MSDDKPKDLKPATEFGEVKVIKNALEPGKAPGSGEAGGRPVEEPAVKPPPPPR